MKDYKLYLRRDRTIDINLITRSRLTECNLNISSIPFREIIEAYDAIIVDSHIEDTYLRGFFKVDEGMVVHSEIDQIIRNIMERGESALVIDSRADFSSTKDIDLVQDAVLISCGTTELHATGFMKADDTIVFSVLPLEAELRYSLGSATNLLELSVPAVDTIKQTFLQPEVPVEITNLPLEFLLTYHVGAESTLEFNSEVLSLFYDIFAEAETEMAVNASLLDIEEHTSLGAVQNEIELRSNITETPRLEKRGQVDGRIIIEVSEQFKKICNLQTFINPIVFSATAQAIIRRYRLLQEMDDLDVATFDDMMLDDVDYVTI